MCRSVNLAQKSTPLFCMMAHRVSLVHVSLPLCLLLFRCFTFWGKNKSAVVVETPLAIKEAGYCGLWRRRRRSGSCPQKVPTGAKGGGRVILTYFKNSLSFPTYARRGENNNNLHASSERGRKRRNAQRKRSRGISQSCCVERGAEEWQRHWTFRKYCPKYPFYK